MKEQALEALKQALAKGESKPAVSLIQPVRKLTTQYATDINMERPELK